MVGSPPDGADAPGHERRWTRRRVVTVGVGAVAAVGVAGVVGVELVSRGVVPGQQTLDRIDGACSVPQTPLRFSPLGPSMSGTFYSHARNQSVGYTLAYPPGHSAGTPLPLIVMLHGFGANHATALSRMSPAQAVALHVNGQLLAPMAMVTVDGGRGYWNPHPGDNPMAMVIDELIPKCQRLGLGAPPLRIGTMGVSMGGYGAILLGEKYPHLISCVAAISPAIWTSYAQAQDANPGAYASAGDFATDDAVTHASALAGVPVRVASGDSDPFHPGVLALAKALPKGAVVELSPGCHTGAFFTEQEPPALAFLAQHLTG
jgi:enterochelin esterase-like enzyme